MPEWITDIRAILGILTVVVGATWTIAYWVASVNSDRRALRRDIDDDRNTIKGFMDEIRSDIKKILTGLSPSIATGSPITLTDLGEQIAADLGAYNWASGLAPSLLEEVRDRKPFQVDEFCVHYTENRLGEEWGERIAASAYERGIPKEGVRAVLRVVLRDELLKLLGLAEAD